MAGPDTWIVLIEDRHDNTGAEPFSSEEAAAAYARGHAGEDAEEEPLTERMTEDGWTLLISYGTEGDCVRVVRRTVDAPRG
jgi:hypothetical protein